MAKAVRKTAFRKEIEAAINRRHCKDHPLTLKWAKGEVSRNAHRGWATEHYHWVTKVVPMFMNICVGAPRDVIAFQMENFKEETDEEHSHLDVLLKFAKANGASVASIKKGRGLPTTESWVRFQREAVEHDSWIAGVAAINIGTESQSPELYSRMLPALRKVYKYKEDEIEHFWLHVEADEDHGARAFEALERHCTTRALKDFAIHWAYESARMRWLYFDGIYLHYEMGYKLD